MAAIYMWFDSEEMILTTTLYPVEVIDGMQLAADIYGGSLSQILAEDHQNSADILSLGTYVILITYGTPEEFHQNSSDILSLGTYVILITYGTPEEFHQNSCNILSLGIVDLLVIVDTPDEKLQIDCDVYPSACSMTPI